MKSNYLTEMCRNLRIRVQRGRQMVAAANPWKLRPDRVNNGGYPCARIALRDLCADFEIGGAEAIERCRRERPDVYLRVIASLLTKQVTEKVNPFDEFTDDELEQLAQWLDSHRAVQGNSGEAGKREQAHQLPPDNPPDTFFLPLPVRGSLPFHVLI